MIDFTPFAGLIIGGHYKLMYELGNGGFGSVWLAESPRFPMSYLAIKFLKRQSGNALVRFRREAKSLANLQHPGIVRCLDDQTDGPVPFIVMEHVSGIGLDRAIFQRASDRQNFDPSEIIYIAESIANALSFAHEHRVIHRDLKPSNIMLLPLDPPQIKLLDFGLAKGLDSQTPVSTDQHVVGSLFYLSPEQVFGEDCEPVTDLFALATVLFELFTLHLAWARDNNDQPLGVYNPRQNNGPNEPTEIMARIANGDRPRLRNLRPNLPRGIEDLFHAAWEPRPSRRPASVSSFVQDLKTLLGDPTRWTQNPPKVTATKDAPISTLAELIRTLINEEDTYRQHPATAEETRASEDLTMEETQDMFRERNLDVAKRQKDK